MNITAKQISLIKKALKSKQVIIGFKEGRGWWIKSMKNNQIGPDICTIKNVPPWSASSHRSDLKHSIACACGEGTFANWTSIKAEAFKQLA